MTTKLEVYNMAISAVRGRGNLTSLTQRSREREECDLWYATIVDVAQEAAFWPCCKSAEQLENGDEESVRGFAYRYALPTDLLRPWYLRELQKFSVEDHDGTNVLFTSAEDPILFFAKRAADPERWPPSLVQAIAFGIAAKIARPLTGKAELIESLVLTANNFLSQAQSTVLNSSGNFLPDTIPDFLSARGIGASQTERFLFPFGETFTYDY